MIQNNVIIKKSNINKKGVFAARNIKKGDVILKWKPLKILTKQEVNKLAETEKHYVSNYKHGEYILQGEPERYMNHSCNPNSEVQNRSDIAIKNIKKGEEITSDYSFGNLEIHFECHCGSKNCKKFI